MNHGGGTRARRIRGPHGRGGAVQLLGGRRATESAEFRLRHQCQPFLPRQEHRQLAHDIGTVVTAVHHRQDAVLTSGQRPQTAGAALGRVVAAFQLREYLRGLCVRVRVEDQQTRAEVHHGVQEHEAFDRGALQLPPPQGPGVGAIKLCGDRGERHEARLRSPPENRIHVSAGHEVRAHPHQRGLVRKVVGPLLTEEQPQRGPALSQ
ncbi:hypothetical protein [Streptomyces sp. NBC_00989]|uniref:hypothetical protein n=1 Tax=Streptomyces sp. NBC_00989 TaxID=2903705 RepID=UPI002F90B5B5|nr:hypothetical protein OG714_54630 [Streptomyces sp. NBC_00989]